MHARIFLAAAMALVSSSAAAADSNAVAVPLGNLLTQALGILEPLAVSLMGVTLTWLLAKLGPDVARAFHAAHIDQVIARSIDAGFALVEGAEKGKVLEIPIANQVIRKAAQYLVDQARPVQGTRRQSRPNARGATVRGRRAARERERRQSRSRTARRSEER